MVLELTLAEVLSYMKPSQYVSHMYVPESDDIVLLLERSNHDGPITSVRVDTARFYVATHEPVEFCMNEQVPVRIMVDATMRQTKHIKKVAEAMQR